jgi:RNA-directed DNA polymerase
MGLHLHPTKTRITHTLDPCEGNVGFDCLGFTVRHYRVGQTHTGKTAKGKPRGFKTIITPSQTARKRHTQQIKRLLRKLRSAPQAAVIHTLTPVIGGWTNCYKGWICSQAFSTCEYITFKQLARWEQARHPGKGTHWLRNRYTIEVNGTLRFGTHGKDKAGNTKSL